MIRKYALFKVFECLRNSMEKESVRSLAKKAKVSVSTSKRCLDYLLEGEIVKREVIGKLYQSTLNVEDALTRHLKIAFSIAEINDSGLVKELTSMLQITSITLFGSIALGTDTPNSDIDILIITNKDVKLKPLEAEKKLKRELSIIKYAHAEWRKKALTDKVFYEKVIIDGLALYGELPVIK